MLLVQERTLAALLNLSQKRMAYIAKHEGFRAETINKVKHYFTAEVNAYLAANSRNFRAPPTVKALLQHDVTLVKLPVAAKLIRKARNTTAELAETEFSTVRVGVFTLVSTQSVITWKQRNARRKRDSLSRKHVAWVLGISENTVSRLVADGRLMGTEHGGNDLPITYGSVVRLVTELLPPGDRAEEWIEDRLASNRPLKSMTAFGLHGNKKALAKVRYIKHPNVTWQRQTRLAMPESVLLYLRANEPAYTTDDVLRLWGIEPTPDSVRRYKRLYPDALSCPLHDHSLDAAYYLSCLAAILEKAGLRRKALHWCQDILTKGGEVVSRTYVTKTLSIGWRKYDRLCQSGRLLSLITPGGDPVILKSNFDQLKHQLEQEKSGGAA